LQPYKPDTALRGNDQLDKTNTMVMYNNMMEKYKWGNMKNARYLDHESSTMFYPLILSSFSNLAQNLIQEGHPDLALKALHRYLEVMPDIYPDVEAAIRKNFIAQTFYQLNEPKPANDIMKSIDVYLKDQLDYNYNVLQKSPESVDIRTLQYGISVLNDMATITKRYQQTSLANDFANQVKDYSGKFSGLLGQRR